MAGVRAMTALLDVSYRAALRQGSQPAAHRALLTGNAVRAALRSGRGAVAADMAVPAIA